MGISMDKTKVAEEIVKVTKMLMVDDSRREAALPFGKEHGMVEFIQDCLDEEDIPYRKVRVDPTFGGNYVISVELSNRDDAKNRDIFVWNCCHDAAKQIDKKYNKKIVGYSQIKKSPQTVGISIGFENK